MKIIITGTKGFIGQNLYNRLKDGNDILQINEDIFNSDKWESNLYKILSDFSPKVVFHVGACSDTLEQDVNYMMKVNYLFTEVLSTYCKIFKCKLIYSSSAANYGDNGRYPSNLYGWSKYTAEQGVLHAEGIALRYFNVYGPLEHNKGKMASVASQMIQKNNNGEEIKLFPGKPKRDFVYIDDVISANLYALEHYHDNCGRWFEVGSGTAKTFEDVMSILNIAYTYHDEYMIPKGYQFFTNSHSASWMKGWKPQYTLEKGLTEYLSFLNK